MRMLEEEVPEPEPVPALGAGAWWKRVAWPSKERPGGGGRTGFSPFAHYGVCISESILIIPSAHPVVIMSKTQREGAHSFALPAFKISFAYWEGEQISARCHYTSASVDNVIFNLNDDVFIKAGPDEESYIGRITEFFQGRDDRSYFTCRWFFLAADTVISPKLLKVHDHQHNDRRVFLSEEKNDNMIESIICKLNIIYVAPNEIPQAKDRLISNSDYYYDMSYSVACSTFANLPAENDDAEDSDATSNISCEEGKPVADLVTYSLLDLYSGCGAMSTGLCLGAELAGIKLETKWAVDMNSHACESLKHNHPSTQVRNEKAEDFLSLLQQWNALCKKYVIHGSNSLGSDLAQASNDDGNDENESLPKDVFEVERLVDICYGDPNKTGKNGLWFKVLFGGKKYDASQDTWEPIDGLSYSYECIKEFVQSGYRDSILPLPGSVDLICGGPPCQGVSGFNRFRKPDDPLTDEKNKQLVVFMDIVKYLRPKYVLMENVVDILKFADGFLGHYALSRLVSMNYQARLGMMVAGCYGLPQFRMRAFIWGALPSMVLPKFPLPTHDVIKRGLVPNAFLRCLVAYEETANKYLKKALVLEDAISDLQEVQNNQPNDVMEYGSDPKTEFQRYIRLSSKGVTRELMSASSPVGSYTCARSCPYIVICYETLTCPILQTFVNVCKFIIKFSYSPVVYLSIPSSSDTEMDDSE
ncbi:DNA (cytosine-5)-methyltransferase CMT1-like [Triticum urartu]|uniref:DNA (cytosine-5)-methyltransferase CMT1-like n=1 Tax=Triticum urartu TaxID=4572 RepID=UPI002043C180|nr:DNA (cytosine-5)-methyltransferase CMT1-like [Triticum urartu]